MRLNLALLLFLFFVIASLLTGCRPPEQSDVLAEVGGHFITLDQLPEYFMTPQLIESMVGDTLILAECNERGITLDPLKYEESMNTFMLQRGGRDATEEWLEQNGIKWSDIFYFNKMQILRAQLMEDIVGEPTEEEIQALWDEKKDIYTRGISSSIGIAENEITINDAREEIINDWKGVQMQEVQMNFIPQLKEKYNVKNYITGEGLDEEVKNDETGVTGEQEEEKETEDTAMLDLTEVKKEEEGSGHGESEGEGH